MKQMDIFIAFFRSSMLGYGGGPTTIPLVQKEVVERFKWMDNEEFGDILAIGNTLPGPINTKMAGYIGYRIGGIPGTINAILATILPTIILMIILLTTLTAFKDLAWVQGMTKGVLPVVGVMLAVLTKDFLQASIKSLKWAAVLLHVMIALVLIEFLNVHPAFLIAALLAFALLKPVKKSEKNNHDKGPSA